MKNAMSVLLLIVSLIGCTPEQQAQWQQAQQNAYHQKHPLEFAQQDASEETSNICQILLVKTKKQQTQYQQCYKQQYPGILQARIQQASAMQQSIDRNSALQQQIQQQNYQNQIQALQVNRHTVNCNSYAYGNSISTSCQ